MRAGDSLSALQGFWPLALALPLSVLLLGGMWMPSMVGTGLRSTTVAPCPIACSLGHAVLCLQRPRLLLGRHCLHQLPHQVGWRLLLVLSELLCALCLVAAACRLAQLLATSSQLADACLQPR